MSDRDGIPPSESPKEPVGWRVSAETKHDFMEFVHRTYGKRKGAYGKALEFAMREFIDRDRYARVNDELNDVRSTVSETNAMVRQIITAEKEKGVFLESASAGNGPGDRRDRENAVIIELVRQIEIGDLDREVNEKTLNKVITTVAEVSSEPTKRNFRETLIERELLEPKYSRFYVTDKAFELAGVEEIDVE